MDVKLGSHLRSLGAYVHVFGERIWIGLCSRTPGEQAGREQHCVKAPPYPLLESHLLVKSGQPRLSPCAQPRSVLRSKLSSMEFVYKSIRVRLAAMGVASSTTR